MIGSCELKARVEESLGTVLDPDFFGQAEQYARPGTGTERTGMDQI